LLGAIFRGIATVETSFVVRRSESLMQPFESIRQLTLPAQVASRLRELMRRRSEGSLNASERGELDLLVEAQETLAVLRAKAEAFADSAPGAPMRPVRTARNGLPVLEVPAGTPAIDPVAVRRFLEEQAF
jgi:hypothetical protein